MWHGHTGLVKLEVWDRRLPKEPRAAWRRPQNGYNTTSRRTCTDGRSREPLASAEPTQRRPVRPRDGAAPLVAFRVDDIDDKRAGPGRAVAAVLIVATAIRLPFVEFNPSVMGDVNTMANWARILTAAGPTELLALTGQSVLYPPLSLAAIWIGGAIDQPVLVIKLLGIVGDIGLAALVAWMLRARSPRVVIGATAAIAFNPALWYLSAFWGQIDSSTSRSWSRHWLCLPPAATVSGWAAWALGLAWKLQALVIAPVLALATFATAAGAGC